MLMRRAVNIALPIFVFEQLMIERPDTFGFVVHRMRFVQVDFDVVVVDLAAGVHSSFVARQDQGTVNVFATTGETSG